MSYSNEKQDSVNDGAMWATKSKGGLIYYKGKIDEVDYVMFPNKSQNPKAPDFTFKKSTKGSGDSYD